MTLNEIVGQNIQNLRKANKMTQQDLANMFNYTANAVSKWERGDTLPEIATLKTIADKFSVTVDCLLTEGGYLQTNKFANNKKLNLVYLIQSLLGSSLIWTVIAILFVYLFQNEVEKAWKCFIWGVPFSLFPPMYIYRKEKMPVLKFILSTIIVWGILLAVYIQYIEIQLSLIFLIGIPAQLSLFLWTKIIDIGK